MNNGQHKRELPHWLACCVNRVVSVWTVDQQSLSGFFAHAGDGFIELILRSARSSSPESTQAAVVLDGFAPGAGAFARVVDAAINQTYTHRHTFIHIQHICRIEPAEAQWQLPRLAVPDKPALVLPS